MVRQHWMVCNKWNKYHLWGSIIQRQVHVARKLESLKHSHSRFHLNCKTNVNITINTNLRRLDTMGQMSIQVCNRLQLHKTNFYSQNKITYKVITLYKSAKEGNKKYWFLSTAGCVSDIIIMPMCHCLGSHLVGWWRLSRQTRPLGLVQQGQIIGALRRQTVPHWA